MSYSDRRSRIFGCGLLLLVGMVVLGLPLAWLAGGPYTSTFPRTFDSEAWKAADPTGYPDDDTRCGMVADLQFRIGIEGKTRGEVLRLLGEPESWPGEATTNYWPLCPSFLDVWVLTVRWESGRAVEAVVHDT